MANENNKAHSAKNKSCCVCCLHTYGARVTELCAKELCAKAACVAQKLHWQRESCAKHKEKVSLLQKGIFSCKASRKAQRLTKGSSSGSDSERESSSGSGSGSSSFKQRSDGNDNDDGAYERCRGGAGPPVCDVCEKCDC